MSLQPGEPVDVLVEFDDAPREVEVPDELAAALGEDPDARAVFERLLTASQEWADLGAGEGSRTPDLRFTRPSL
jgi:hypothetical protein